MALEIQRSGRPREAQIAELADCQYGIVARGQLKALGLSEGAIDARLTQGRLHRVHRGVYAVGHSRLGARGRWLAAVLTCGHGAVLSHRSAAALWGLGWSGAAHIDVTGSGRGQVGIRIHRSRGLHQEDRSTRDSIPVTSLARTLLDLASSVPQRQLERALEQADRLDMLDMVEVDALLDRTSGHHGIGPLTARLADYRPTLETRSELELAFLALCREAGLPMPAVNVWVAEYEVDAFWAAEGVIVELDGYEFHRTRAAFERDRARDAALQLAGYRVLRVTARRLANEPGWVTAAIRALLHGGRVSQAPGFVTIR
jgi:predicted transcriptional regulator of viral defense system